ncbi:MAG: MBL fold metallo-hydrolase [Proteobacteria bacterium]|nr:MBL fold metallo-hydrolase [Pseudomonadota bacterium]
MANMRYKNAYPHAAHGLLDVLRWKLGLGPPEVSVFPPGDPSPRKAVNFAPVTANLHQPDPGRVQVTWIGHSTFLIQHRGRNILTDPIFGNCDPLPLARLRRAAPPGVPLAALPPIHDVLISHCHYDHLDVAAIKHFGNQAAYWVPSGLTGWFQKRGLTRCRELAWGESAPFAEGIEIHCVPAQHFAARTPFDRNQTHWCGWVLRSPSRSVYFAGDTGYCPGFKEIGERFGGFDLAMIPIGAYQPRWFMHPMHVNPAEAVQIHLDVRSRQSVACHWGTFALTDEPLDEPPRHLAAALALHQIPPETFRALAFGEALVI